MRSLHSNELLPVLNILQAPFLSEGKNSGCKYGYKSFNNIAEKNAARSPGKHNCMYGYNRQQKTVHLKDITAMGFRDGKEVAAIKGSFLWT